MSGQKKGRALALTAIMVLSVIATGMAFTGTVAADDRTDDLSIDVTPDNITVGSQDDTVSVEVTNADDQNETYSYTVTDPDGNDVVTGDSETAQFSFALDPDSEGDYNVQVTANEDNTTSNESDTDSETVTAQYDLNFAPQEVAAGDYQQVITGVLQNDQGDGISGEVLSLNAPDGTSIDTSASDADGQVSFQFTPDETGDYTITNPDSGVTYGAVTVTPTELTVMSDKMSVTAGNEETVNFTVNNSNGEQVNLSENNIDFNISQNGSSVQSNGMYVDTDDDGQDEVYRTDIDADQNTDDVNVTASNDTAEGMTTLDVETTDVSTNASDDLTKGVRTGAIEFSSSDADGNDTDDGDFRFVADGGTVELSFNDNDGDLSVSSDDDVDTSDDDIELEDGESAVVTDADDNDLNASAFAFNNSDLDRSVELDVASQTDDDGDDSDGLYGDNTTLTFDALNGEAEPDAIPVTGDSAIDVTTTNGADEPFNRSVTLDDGAGVDVSGNTGDDGMTTFSVNPDQTGTIDLNVSYDDEYVDGDSDAPDSVQTDTVEVNNDGDDNKMGDLNAPDSVDFGSVDVGDSTTQSVTLSNEGNASITVTQTSIKGVDGADFNVVGDTNAGGPGDDDSSFVIAPGESKDVSVEYAPDDAGDNTATFVSNTKNDGRETTTLTGTATEQQRATVNFEDQTSDDGQTVTVDSVYVPNDGYVAIHNATQLQNGKVQQSVIGVSEYLEGGQTYNDVEVTLFDVPGRNFDDDMTLDDGDQTLIAMPHKETNGNEQYNFITSDGSEDGPYTDENGNAVVDSATVTYNAPEEGSNADHTITFVGNGNLSKYKFSVTDDLQKSTANGANINTGDEVRRGYVGVGEVGISRDSYTYNGSLQTIDVNGDATVLVDGKELGDDVDDMRDNVIEIAGTGDASNYDFAATNGNERIQKVLSNNANINNGDKIFRTTGNGQVGISKDAFGFNGVIDSLEVNGDAEVYVNGREVNPENEQDNMITIVGNGEAANYQFTVDEGGLAPSNANYANTNSNDEISGMTKTGVVGISADSNDYNGDITDFSADGDVQVYIDGQQIDQDDVADEA